MAASWRSNGGSENQQRNINVASSVKYRCVAYRRNGVAKYLRKAKWHGSGNINRRQS